MYPKPCDVQAERDVLICANIAYAKMADIIS